MLYCALTGQLIDKNLEAVKLHMRGKRFQAAQGEGPWARVGCQGEWSGLDICSSREGHRGAWERVSVGVWRASADYRGVKWNQYVQLCSKGGRVWLVPALQLQQQ